MKAWFLSILLVAPTICRAADNEPFHYRGSGYGYFAVGACQHSTAIFGGGGGGEGFVWKGLTLGVEGGVQKFADADRPFGEFLVPVGYHFVDRKQPAKWDPFVSVAPIGLAGGLNYAATAAFRAGGGVTYWFHRRIGIRTEFHGTFYGTYESTAQARFGISFR